MSGSRNLFSNG